MTFLTKALAKVKGGALFTLKWVLPSLLILTILGALILRVFFLSFVDKHELGYSYNKISGEIVQFERTGYFLFPPWFFTVHSIDLRPMQLQITANSFGNRSAQAMKINQRVLNAKLVRFNPQGLQTFIEFHGRDAGDNRRELAEILRCYAFDRSGGRDCPFLSIEKELNPSQMLKNAASPEHVEAQ